MRVASEWSDPEAGKEVQDSILGLHSQVTEGKTKNWMVCNSEIRKSLNIEPLLLPTER